MRAGRVIMLENSEFNMHMSCIVVKWNMHNYVLYRCKMED